MSSAFNGCSLLTCLQTRGCRDSSWCNGSEDLFLLEKGKQRLLAVKFLSN